jgi:Mn-containing catalase
MIGYLLVRGSLHGVVYAKALEKLTGVEMTKMLPVPRIETPKIPESKKVMETWSHTKLYQSRELQRNGNDLERYNSGGTW